VAGAAGQAILHLVPPLGENVKSCRDLGRTATDVNYVLTGTLL
jgi:hypothetical protein